MKNEHSLNRLAARQHGLATTGQLERLGFTRHQRAHHLRLDLWRKAAPGVVDIAPASFHVLRPLHAAVLSTGGWAAGRSAAALLGLLPAQPDRPEILVPESVRPRHVDAAVLRTTTFDPITVRRIEGIASTNAERTLFDLGRSLTDDELAIAVNQALVRRQSTIPRLMRGVDAGPLRGRPGAAAMRRVLDRYRHDQRACESVLESLLDRAIEKSLLPPAHRQYVVCAASTRFRLDFAWPDQKVFVEADGLEFHTTRDQFDKDRRRQNALVALGWTPLRFSWTDLTQRPQHVPIEIDVVLQARTR